MKTRVELEKMGKRILALVKQELYLDMPYLSYAIGSVTEIMDLSTRTIGCDGRSVRFNPTFLFEEYIDRPESIDRIYMHMLLHNLLLHPFSPNARDELWDLACDITVESIVDDFDCASLRRVTSDFRAEWYSKIKESIRLFSAPRLYEYFRENRLQERERLRLEREFALDDHSFWRRSSDKEEKPRDDIKYIPNANIPLKEVWEKVAKAVQVEAEQSGSDRSGDAGRLTSYLKLSNSSMTDYAKILKKYMTVREVCRVDPDAFDMAYYMYGMEVYGNMPLIEELEGREEKHIETIAIAIDTSASTRRRHVRRFLEETAAILSMKESFFDRINIIIIECDDHVQRVVNIKDKRGIDDYLEGLSISGGYGTDFRPVFSYIRDRRKMGELRDLRVLLYFTDGYGIYPKNPGDYDVDFVFLKSCDYNNANVPDWAGSIFV